MSTLSMFIEEGKEEAVEKTKIETVRKTKIEAVRKMMKNEFTIQQIKLVLDVDEAFIEDAIKSQKK